MVPESAIRPQRRRLCRAAARAAAFAVLLALAPAVRATAACLPARQVFSVREAGGAAFRQPSDIALAGERILVLDDLNGRVAVLDRQGRGAGSIPLPGAGGASWLGVGFGGADEVFLSAAGDGRVFVLNLRGAKVRDFAVGARKEDGRPAGLVVARGRCFVTDNGAQMVRVFTLDGTPTASWGGPGEGASQFRSPFRIALDSLDRVLVVDSLNSRVLAFTPKGEPLAAFGEFGTTEGTLFRPAGIAVLDADRILVSDAYFGSLQVFDAQGAYQGVLCGAEGRPLALESPMGVAASGSTVYVVEMGAGRVSAWELGRQ